MVAYALPQPLKLPLPVGSLGGAEWWPMAADGTAARAMASGWSPNLKLELSLNLSQRTRLGLLPRMTSIV